MRAGEKLGVVDERSERPAFGALLRARRVAAGFTQDDLAARASLSVQAISALERGARHAPRGDTLALLTAALELSGDALSEFEAAARSSVKSRVRTTQPLFKVPSGKRLHLPQFATPFFGRDRDARVIASAVVAGGCTTLWGTGGVGKTRLAVETTALVEDRFDRIAFVGLASAIGDDSVDDAIASALGIVREPGESVFARIAAELSERRWLVIVDNCEHVIAGAARALSELSTASPHTAFLCTSREPMRIDGERVLKVGALEAGDAQRLFLDRAATLLAGGVLSEADARDVATICRRLDGIPLALELAAACARVLDLEHVASGLDARFRLLTRGNRATSDRHTTLHATIAWSYELLSDAERHAFEHAAVINGSFSLDDLLSIAVGPGCDRAAVLASTAALVDKSLLVVENGDATARRRYRMLESTRAFALESAEQRAIDTGLIEAHRRWGARLSERARRSIDMYRGGNGAAIHDIDLDHVRGYLDWAIEKRHDVPGGTSLAGRIHLTWDLLGLHAEGLRRIESGLALLSGDDANGAAAMMGWHAVSRLNQRLVRNGESLAPALRAYELAGLVGDGLIRASSAAKVAVAYDNLGKRDDALAYANEAIDIFDRIGDHHSATYSACTAAIIAFKIRGDDEALEELRLAVERMRALGDPRRTSSTELDLGEAYYALGHVDAAIAAATSALTQFRKTASLFELAICLNNLGIYLCGSGRLTEAAPLAREALQIGYEGRYTRTIALAAQTFATISALRGRERRRCVELFAYVRHRYQTIGEIGYTETAAHACLRRAIDGILPAAEFANAVRAGETFDDAAAYDAALRCVKQEATTA